MNYVHIKSHRLRKFLLRYYDRDGDGKLSVSDLESVEMLEITTPRLQLWDERPDLSLTTRCFCHPSDLARLPRLKCLVVSGQPVFGAGLQQNTLMEVLFIRCPVSRITIRGMKAFWNRRTRSINWIAPDHPYRDQIHADNS